MLHPGKLRLRQGRWNLSELDSASSDGVAAGHPSSPSCHYTHAFTLRVQPHSHPHVHIRRHMHKHNCLLCTLMDIMRAIFHMQSTQKDNIKNTEQMFRCQL